MSDAEKWKARAGELLDRRLRCQTDCYFNEDCECVDAIAAALAEAAAEGRESALTEVVSRVAERDYDAAKIVSEIAKSLLSHD